MAQKSEHLERLVRELAALNPEDRAQVVASVARLQTEGVRRGRFQIPTLRGGSAWVGGTLSRDELYSDDGR